MLELFVNGQAADDSINRFNFISHNEISFVGTIDNTGSTIVVTGNQNLFFAENGEIDGGTVNVTNGAIFEILSGNAATFQNVTMNVSDGGELMVDAPFAPGVVPATDRYTFADITLNIAFATDVTLSQLYYESPTGMVSIADEAQPEPSQSPSTPSQSMQASVTEQIAVASAPQVSPMASAAPVALAAPVAKAAPAIHASQAISGTTTAVFSQSLIGVVSQIESGGSAVDNLLFGEEPIFA